MRSAFYLDALQRAGDKDQVKAIAGTVKNDSGFPEGHPNREILKVGIEEAMKRFDPNWSWAKAEAAAKKKAAQNPGQRGSARA